MNQFIQWESLEGEPDFAQMEAFLVSTLVPVVPRAGFVRDLRRRLLNHAPVYGTESHGLRNGILAIAGLATSVLILIAGVRATLTLLSSLGILHQVKDQVKQNQAAPLNPIM